MTKDFKQQAEMLAAMFAMAGMLSNGKSNDLDVNVAKRLGQELVDSFLDEDDTGIAAIKPKAKK